MMTLPMHQGLTFNKKNRMDRELELELIELAKNGDQRAKDQLVLANTGLIKDYCRKLTLKGNYTHSDAFQDGVIGLIKAIEKFDLSSGHRFCTYAVLWVKAEVYRQALYQDGTLNVPADMPKLVKEGKASYPDPMTIDAKMNDHGDTFSDLYVDEFSEKDTTAPLEKAEGRDYIDELLTTLTPMQARIVRMRYLEGVSIKQCCIDLNTTEHRLKKATAAAMRHLKLVAKAGAVESYLEIFERD